VAGASTFFPSGLCIHVMLCCDVVVVSTGSPLTGCESVSLASRQVTIACANTSFVFQMRLLVLSESSENSNSAIGYSDYIAPESYGNTQTTQMNTEFHVNLIFLYAAACMILRVRFTTKINFYIDSITTLQLFLIM